MDHHHHQAMAMATATGSSKNKKQCSGGGERSSRAGGRSCKQQITAAAVQPPSAMRKGPWTEEEDAQLVWFVRLFGERRWDFLAKVSGLRRTGKSCRLRWVNYLHPGLRRGRITADEERLILQLHEQWGSRWSRIARSLPGRTDNEIKNFWRTRARKQKAAAAAAAAQHEGRRSCSKTASASACSASASASVTTTTASCSGPPSPSSACGTATSSSAATESALRQSSVGEDDDEDAELDEACTTTAASQHHHQHGQQQECYASDHFWNDIAAAEAAASYMLFDSWAGAGPGHPAAAAEPPSSPAWEYCSLWRIDDDEYYKKMLDSS